MRKRDHIAEAFATMRGALGIFLTFSFGFILLGTIALKGVLDGKWSEHFMLGNAPIPTYYGAGASNLDVFIFCCVGIVILCGVIVSRYFYYRDVIESLRKKGIKDYDKDGQIDSFADDFLDDDFS